MEREERNDRKSGHAREPAGHHPDEALLDRYRTRELEEAERRQMESHLAGCPSCRIALDRLATFAQTLERGYAASHAGEREPDWGRLRAAIVARTSGRAVRHRRGWLVRHAPQTALAVLALIAVGVLVEQGVRGPADVERALRRSPTAALEDRAVGAAERSDAPTTAGAGQAVDAEERDSVRHRAEAPPPKRPEETRRETAQREPAAEAPVDELEVRAPVGAKPDALEEARPADGVSAARAGNQMECPAPEQAAEAPGIAPPAAEGFRAKGEAEIPPEVRRFEERAREAIDGRDADLAASALGQWRDSLAPRTDLPPELKRAAQALADSLAAFLATVP